MYTNKNFTLSSNTLVGETDSVYKVHETDMTVQTEDTKLRRDLHFWISSGERQFNWALDSSK